LDPQITGGLLTDAAGFPLTVQAFEGNKAETKTMIPVLTSFMTAHQLAEVTVVADAGMFSEANQHDIEDAGLSFILANPNPRDPLSRRPMAPRASRRTDPGRARVHPTMASHDSAEVPGPAGQDHLLPIQGRQGAPCAGSMSRSPRPRPPWPGRSRSSATGSSPCPGRIRASTVTGGQGPRPGRPQGLHHQPARTDRGVRDRRLPPALHDRGLVSHVQTRPGRPPDLPPQTTVRGGCQSDVEDCLFCGWAVTTSGMW
jgi:hypothetical protein